MQAIRLGSDDLTVSRLHYGCMRIAGDGSPDALRRGRRAVLAAVEQGYTLFDHADIYAGGASEALFGELLAATPGLRDGLVIASKCGIRFANDPAGSPARYDFSATHIRRSVEGSLRRLCIEQLDLLLLHRPDYLIQAEAVAATFAELHSAGKVKHFGVSNFSPSQFELLQAALDQRLLVNQVEINLHNTDALLDGTLDQCQRLGVTPQAWSPLAAVAWPVQDGGFSAADMARLETEIRRQAEQYGCDPSTVALAWLLRHPAQIAPVIGSVNPGRIAAATKALAIDYQAEDWYALLEARNGRPVP